MTKQERHRTFRRMLRGLGLNCRQAGDYLGVNPATVRAWHAGLEPVPPLRIIQLENYGAAWKSGV